MIKKMTIDDLALMIRNTMATKEDAQELKEQMATKVDLQQLEERMVTNIQQLEGRMATNIQAFREESNARFDHLDARVGRIEADIHELQEGVVYRHEFEDALGRIKYIERKLGIESGVEL